MPINACSINRHTINGKCGLTTIINVPTKGHVRNIPPIYSRLNRDEEEYIIPINYEQPHILVSLEVLGEIYTEMQDNSQLDMGSIVFINNLNAHETNIMVNINDFNVHESKILLNIDNIKVEK